MTPEAIVIGFGIGFLLMLVGIGFHLKVEVDRDESLWLGFAIGMIIVGSMLVGIATAWGLIPP